MEDVITIETKIKITDDMADIIRNPQSDKYYQMTFCGSTITVSISDRINPILMQYMAMVDLAFSMDKKLATEFVDKLENNYGVVIPKPVKTQMLDIMKEKSQK